MNLSQIFESQFGRRPEFTVRAPGRVNLIGEHTDYNDGFVLPCAIDFATHVAIAPNGSRSVRVYAADYGERDEFSLDTPIAPSDKQWANYIRGVIWALAEHGFRLPEGVDIAVSGNVPQGAGLSSSAALEVAIGKAVQHVFRLPLSATEIAQIGQYAENRFVGCNCGIMDLLELEITEMRDLLDSYDMDGKHARIYVGYQGLRQLIADAATLTPRQQPSTTLQVNSRRLHSYIYNLSREEGGHALSAGDSMDIWIGGQTVRCKLVSPQTVAAGETPEVLLEAEKPLAVFEGQRFLLQQNGRPIAPGVVATVE